MSLPAADLASFVVASPSSYHAAAEVARRLRAAGFEEHDETQAFRDGTAQFVCRDGAIIAWRSPATVGPQTGFRIVGTHTDSPGFKLKPEPMAMRHGFSQAAMEVYGGPLLNSWLDREFGLAGRVISRTGEVRLVSTPAWLRIPQLAPHLDRSVNENLHLDRQLHLKPVAGTGPIDIVGAVAEQVGWTADEVDGHDLFAAVTEAPAIIGVAGDFLASGRLDNLSSVHAAVEAFTNTAQGSDFHVLVCFDHEEIGSCTRSGAQGPFLSTILRRISASHGWDEDAHFAALARSFVISADAGHSVHPNYAHMHDPEHLPELNRGPLLKVNANQRYTSEGPSSARWMRMCRAAGVPTQPFVSNNAVPCGSTIGPFVAANIAVSSVDVGIGLLSMHSAREMCGVTDVGWFIAALSAFWAEADN